VLDDKGEGFAPADGPAESWLLLVGEARGVLAGLPEQSVQCCMTSPPYWGLRDYGIPGQIGLETTPAEYVATLVDAFRGVRRLLKDDGTLWLNLSDSYAAKTMKPKDLTGIPWRVAFALQADGWYLRSDIIWAKPNGKPESVKDRPTRTHEYLFLLAKSERYYYNADAIREPLVELTRKQSERRREMRMNRGVVVAGVLGQTSKGVDDGAPPTHIMRSNPAGKNKRSVWTVPTQPYRGAHFATFPEKLVEPCVLAGSRPGDCVLDPFCGAGTVAVVATRLERRSISIDLNPEYIALAEQRLMRGGTNGG
jgi:DNA modification methylase